MPWSYLWILSICRSHNTYNYILQIRHVPYEHVACVYVQAKLILRPPPPPPSSASSSSSDGAPAELAEVEEEDEEEQEEEKPWQPIELCGTAADPIDFYRACTGDDLEWGRQPLASRIPYCLTNFHIGQKWMARNARMHPFVVTYMYLQVMFTPVHILYIFQISLVCFCRLHVCVYVCSIHVCTTSSCLQIVTSMYVCMCLFRYVFAFQTYM